MADALVPPSQNSVYQSFNDFTNTLTNFAQGAANVYSTFLGAKTASKIAEQQKVATPMQPTTSELNAIKAGKVTQLATYGFIGLALVATAMIVLKNVR